MIQSILTVVLVLGSVLYLGIIVSRVFSSSCQSGCEKCNTSKPATHTEKKSQDSSLQKKL